MRIGVITFPGTLDDVDAIRAVRLAGGDPVALWHADHDLRGVDAVVVPGGFSYGDYLRAGAIAARAPIMDEVIAAAGRACPSSASATASRSSARPACCPARSPATPACTSSAATWRCAWSPTATAWTGGVRRRPGDRRPAQVRRGPLRRRRRHPRRAGGRGPGRLPLRRRRAERVVARHRGRRLGERARRRAHAAPRARGRPPHRTLRGRPRPVHVRARGRREPVRQAPWPAEWAGRRPAPPRQARLR